MAARADIRDKLRRNAQPFLQPREEIQAVIDAYLGEEGAKRVKITQNPFFEKIRDRLSASTGYGQLLKRESFCWG